MAKLTHKQMIEKVHIALMRSPQWVWLAPVCMIGNVELRSDVPTAGTNGRDVIYGTTFLDKCDEGQRRATVVHENMHKAYRHLRVYEYLHKKYDAQYPGVVNMAMDYVINRDIKKFVESAENKGFMRMWDGLIEYCWDAKYDDDMKWDTPRVLEDLIQQAEKGKPGDGQDGHDWKGSEDISEEEAQAIEKQIEQALRQGQQLAKSMAGNMPRDVAELLTPAVDWRQALRDFVTERVRGGEFATYAKPNRRYVGYNVYMPSTYTETIESILFACDTSGSISNEDIRDVLSEVQGCLEVVRPETVDIMYWDTAVAKHEHYAGADVHTIMGSTKPAGGGGTSPSCVVQFCRERRIKPAVVVWLSDGYVGNDWGEELDVPAFWVITSGGCVPSHLPHVMLPGRNG